MSKKIHISELEVGMFVVEVGDGSFNSPVTSIRKPITSEAQIAALKETAVSVVVIDPDKTSKRTSPSASSSAFLESVGKVNEKMGKAVAYSRSMMEDVRLGKAVDPLAASGVVDSMLETVFTNESAALFLTKLGDYDDYTYMHCVNISVLASVFGRHLGLKEAELHDLGLSGLLHDLGKSLVPDSILNKPGKLTPDEFAVMQSHPLKGYQLLKKVKGLSNEILLGALQHHEKWSGNGYPGGFKGEKISEFARIIAVVDVYDAMTSNRIYHKKRAETDVLGFLFKQKEHFAPSYVERFVKAVGIYPPGTLVRLKNGKIAVVCAVNQANSMLPLVSFVSDDMKIQAECVDLSLLAEAGENVAIAEVMAQGTGSIDLTAMLG